MKTAEQMLSVYLIAVLAITIPFVSPIVIGASDDHDHRQMAELLLSFKSSAADYSLGSQRSTLSSGVHDLPCSQSGYCSLGKVRPWRGQ
jgi:hypothetical protein